MATYRASKVVETELVGVFRYLCDPENLPSYFPRMTSAEAIGPELVRTTAIVDDDQDPDTPDAAVTSEAWFRVDEACSAISWGSTRTDEYYGSLTAVQSDGKTELHLEITTPNTIPGIQESLTETLDAIADNVSNSIKQ